MARDYFEDEAGEPRSTTQGKTTTFEGMEPDFDAHFTQKDADKIKGIAARYKTLEAQRSRDIDVNRARFNSFGGSDPQKFSSFHHTLRYPRSTGFVDFKLQQDRPAFPVNKAHEHRF